MRGHRVGNHDSSLENHDSSLEDHDSSLEDHDSSLAGVMTAAPYKVLDPEHWVFEGTGLSEGAVFGAASFNERIPGWPFVLQSMNFALKMMDCVFEMMDCSLESWILYLK